MFFFFAYEYMGDGVIDIGIFFIHFVASTWWRLLVLNVTKQSLQSLYLVSDGTQNMEMQ